MTQTPVHDRWLFRTPESEAVLPSAVAALAAAMGEPGRSEEAERATLERIVVEGGYGEWLAYLRERRMLLERYVEAQGTDALSELVADVLMNHWLLALTVPGEEEAAEAERSRLADLVRRLGTRGRR
jgi:hypothetical protein